MQLPGYVALGLMKINLTAASQFLMTVLFLNITLPQKQIDSHPSPDYFQDFGRPLLHMQFLQRAS